MKKLLVACVLLVFLLIAAKDFLSTHLVRHFARTFLGSSVSIRRVILSPVAVALQDVSLSYRGATVSLKSGRLGVDWSQFPRPSFAKVTLDSLKFTTKKFAALQAGLAAGSPQQRAQPPAGFFSPHGCEFMLRNFSCDIEGIGEVSLKGTLSADFVVKNGVLFSVKDASLEQVTIKGSAFEVADLSLRKGGDALYELFIPLIVLKEKNIKDVRVQFRQEGSRLLIVPSTITFLGADSRIEGEIDFTDFPETCCDVRVQDLSFTGLLGLVTDPKTFDFAGTFMGAFRLCVSAQGIGELTAEFANTATGFIHLKNDTALDFMRPYVDAASHKALVDNFKNYTYNKSTVSARTENGVIVVDLFFDSPLYGKRTITVALHNDGGKR